MNLGLESADVAIDASGCGQMRHWKGLLNDCLTKYIAGYMFVLPDIIVFAHQPLKYDNRNKLLFVLFIIFGCVFFFIAFHC